MQGKGVKTSAFKPKWKTTRPWLELRTHTLIEQDDHEHPGRSRGDVLHLVCPIPHRHDDAAEKIREYRADYNNRPSNPISFMPAVARTSGHIHCELVSILFLQAHRETAFLLALSAIINNKTDRGAPNV